MVVAALPRVVATSAIAAATSRSPTAVQEVRFMMTVMNSIYDAHHV